MSTVLDRKECPPDTSDDDKIHITNNKANKLGDPVSCLCGAVTPYLGPPRLEFLDRLCEECHFRADQIASGQGLGCTLCQMRKK